MIEHVAAETTAGKPVYIGMRLKVANGKVIEVEINFDDGPRVNIKNLVPYDPIFNTIVPPEERSTREQLERIITSYFKGLTDYQPIQADYGPRCDRYHSGNTQLQVPAMLRPALRQSAQWLQRATVAAAWLQSEAAWSHDPEHRK